MKFTKGSIDRAIFGTQTSGLRTFPPHALEWAPTSVVSGGGIVSAVDRICDSSLLAICRAEPPPQPSPRPHRDRPCNCKSIRSQSLSPCHGASPPQGPSSSLFSCRGVSRGLRGWQKMVLLSFDRQCTVGSGFALQSAFRSIALHPICLLIVQGPPTTRLSSVVYPSHVEEAQGAAGLCPAFSPPAWSLPKCLGFFNVGQGASGFLNGHPLRS